MIEKDNQKGQGVDKVKPVAWLHRETVYWNLTTVSGVGTEGQHSVRVAVLDVELPDHALHLHHLEDKASNLI